MISILTFGWLFFISLSLVVTGRYFQDYTLGILGGFAVFILGLYVMITGITGVDNWYNSGIGAILFGIGAYIWVNGSLEVIKG